MAALQPPIVSRISGGERNPAYFTTFMAKQLCTNAMFINSHLSAVLKSDCSTNSSGASVRVRNCPRIRTSSKFRCRFSSPNDGDSITGNFEPGDADYVNSTVLEAVEVKNGSDGFMIKMRDGRYLRCVYNHPKGGYPPDYISHPAIVLKLDDGSNILLPIIVLEMPSALLMAALHNVEMARPTMYQIVKEMIETIGYMVKYVRLTKRVQEAYFAELCVMKMDSETESLSFDLRPSDAINIAVRCKAPIQVNKSLALKDGLKIVEPTNPTMIPPHSDGSLLLEMDRPDGQPCPESEEFVLLRNMLIAAIEERYHDAAQWKDLLKQFRSKQKKWT
ncbi:bifunctional nuclease 2-like [Chenopodium quinoa]|uniref:bifunctional nuclease 2-like n=1 Tax=Chenopodium quinoa TaxID=63459 RepID=UPI000B7985A8|nr:bifunctional nuclease 2-like [Chenopodium quinoa]XP_021718064.1 bifunctional nuclease 2-like [Chenopodium quinoa]